jgi:Tfp pilus assembly protein PilP
MRALLLLLSIPAVVAAQTPSASAPSQPPADTASQAPQAEPDAYTYQAEGRRDPFLNPLTNGSEPALPSKRGEGAAGMLAGELSVRGVMQSGSALVALVQGPDRKTFVVHSGDKLMDGTIKSVTSQGLVIVQNVNDPLSLEKTREVRKLLRSLEDSK